MSRRKPSRWHGILPVVKSAGPTSHDVVDMARKALRERRVGHTGTLDPLAEGLLLLCVGRATRLQQFLLHWKKSYRGQIGLGYATTTYDSEGEAMAPQGPVPELDQLQLDALASRFTGEIDQRPPLYSAKKVGGKKLYELARDGKEVEIEAKRVTVHDLQLEAVGTDALSLNVTCSTGFYVRSLAHDIGCELGCGAHLSHLRRTCIGPYNLDHAMSQEELQQADAAETVINHPAWVPLDRITLPYPEINLNPGATDRFLHGQEVMLLHAGDQALEPGGLVTVKDQEGRLLGMGTVRHLLARGRTVDLRPSMVLAQS